MDPLPMHTAAQIQHTRSYKRYLPESTTSTSAQYYTIYQVSVSQRIPISLEQFLQNASGQLSSQRSALRGYLPKRYYGTGTVKPRYAILAAFGVLKSEMSDSQK